MILNTDYHYGNWDSLKFNYSSRLSLCLKLRWCWHAAKFLFIRVQQHLITDMPLYRGTCMHVGFTHASLWIGRTYALYSPVNYLVFRYAVALQRIQVKNVHFNFTPANDWRHKCEWLLCSILRNHQNRLVIYWFVHKKLVVLDQK
jgi:hypothetical protein